MSFRTNVRNLYVAIDYIRFLLAWLVEMTVLQMSILFDCRISLT
jgi:hypothetical protein